MLFTTVSATVVAALALNNVNARTIPTTNVQSRDETLGSRHNDFSCQSSTHRNPVVLLHGLGATFYEDINFLEAWLRNKGFCTFSLTYGAYPRFPLVGGLTSIKDSSRQIANFIRQVKKETGSEKVDLIGHSEGAFQTLHVTKFQDISDYINRIVAIAPPTHGTTFANLYSVAEKTGLDGLAKGVLSTFGCKACTELITGGSAVQMLNKGPITQPGVRYTVITSRNDKLVSPSDTAFIDEPGVENIYVQDYCPSDRVGHIGEAYDSNVWNLVLNALEGEFGRKFPCAHGFPVK